MGDIFSLTPTPTPGSRRREGRQQAEFEASLPTTQTSRGTATAGGRFRTGMGDIDLARRIPTPDPLAMELIQSWNPARTGRPAGEDEPPPEGLFADMPELPTITNRDSAADRDRNEGIAAKAREMGFGGRDTPAVDPMAVLAGGDPSVNFSASQGGSDWDEIPEGTSYARSAEDRQSGSPFVGLGAEGRDRLEGALGGVNDRYLRNMADIDAREAASDPRNREIRDAMQEHALALAGMMPGEDALQAEQTSRRREELQPFDPNDPLAMTSGEEVARRAEMQATQKMEEVQQFFAKALGLGEFDPSDLEGLSPAQYMQKKEMIVGWVTAMFPEMAGALNALLQQPDPTAAFAQEAQAQVP